MRLIKLEDVEINNYIDKVRVMIKDSVESGYDSGLEQLIPLDILILVTIIWVIAQLILLGLYYIGKIPLPEGRTKSWTIFDYKLVVSILSIMMFLGVLFMWFISVEGAVPYKDSVYKGQYEGEFEVISIEDSKEWDGLRSTERVAVIRDDETVNSHEYDYDKELTFVYDINVIKQLSPNDKILVKTPERYYDKRNNKNIEGNYNVKEFTQREGYTVEKANK